MGMRDPLASCIYRTGMLASAQEVMHMRKPIAYVAGPLGFSEVGRAFHNGQFIPMLERLGFEILDPWKLTADELCVPVFAMPYGPERRTSLQWLNKIIAKNNADAIVRCDVVVAVLDGTDVDSGTAVEIGFAAALGRAIEGYRGDFRLSADNDGSTVNLQVQHFICSHAWPGKIATTLEELERNLKEGFLVNFAR